VTQSVLEAEGVTVATARTGAEALALLERGAYDLLLCDVGMPEMSGWQVAREARYLQPSMAICMVTGWADEVAQTDAGREGVIGVLAKPIELDALRDVIAKSCPPPAARAQP
jgi:CheY-like chemotaxis protein